MSRRTPFLTRIVAVALALSTVACSGPEDLLREGDALFLEGQSARALVRYQEVTTRWPDSDEARAAKKRVAVVEIDGKIPEAEANLRAAVVEKERAEAAYEAAEAAAASAWIAYQPHSINAIVGSGAAARRADAAHARASEKTQQAESAKAQLAAATSAWQTCDATLTALRSERENRVKWANIGTLDDAGGSR